MTSKILSSLLAAALLIQPQAAWLFAQNVKLTAPAVKGNSGVAPIVPVSVNLNPSVSLPGSGGLSLTPSLLPNQGQPLEVSNAPVLPKATPALEPVSGLSSAEKALEKSPVSEIVAASGKQEPKSQPKTTADALKVLGSVEPAKDGAQKASDHHSAQYDGKAKASAADESGSVLAGNAGVEAQHNALLGWGSKAERTLVVVQSMSLDPDVLKGVSGIEKYEARGIAMILKAREPGVRMVFVTSKPIPHYVIDHVLRGKADAEEIRKRVAFITLDARSGSDSGLEPLSAKLLRPENEGTLRKIAAQIKAYGRPAALIPFISSKLELELSDRLGIPMYASHPALSYWGTKSGSRRIFREAGLPLAPGFEDIQSIAE